LAKLKGLGEFVAFAYSQLDNFEIFARGEDIKRSLPEISCFIFDFQIQELRPVEEFKHTNT
jgi:hypothetical protein